MEAAEIFSQGDAPLTLYLNEWVDTRTPMWFVVCCKSAAIPGADGDHQAACGHSKLGD
ncbi:hypothetical protein K380107A5_08480 [Holdemania massiliensis]